MKRLLLISNSTQHGKSYLEHCAQDIQSFFRNSQEVLFIPYALHDLDGYAKKVKDRFAELGIRMRSIHDSKDPVQTVQQAQGIFIGGGNTFRLLTRLYENKLIQLFRSRVIEGLPYMGSSAGTNMACPTLKTTNDMPIVQPPSFEALNLIPFQINPHYQDPDLNSKHMGETREQRIKEFHEMNSVPVLGLREGSWLWIEENSVELRGMNQARLFLRGQEPKELQTGPLVIS